MGSQTVAAVDDLPEGDRLLVTLEDIEVGVFNIEGEFFAYTNACPHQGGPVCEGMVGGTMVTVTDAETGTTKTEWAKEGQVISCPWCSWEFDLTTGKGISNVAATLSAHEVRIEDDDLIVAVD